MSLPLKEVRCTGCPATMMRDLRSRVADAKCARCSAALKEAWHKAHPENVAAAQKRYRTANADRIEAYNKKWKLDHPARVKIHNRRAHKRWRKKFRKLIATIKDELREMCFSCGAPHTQERRLAVLRRCSDFSVAEIREAYPCLWAGPAGERAIYRDRALLSGKQSGVAA